MPINGVRYALQSKRRVGLSVLVCLHDWGLLQLLTSHATFALHLTCACALPLQDIQSTIASNVQGAGVSKQAVMLGGSTYGLLMCWHLSSFPNCAQLSPQTLWFCMLTCRLYLVGTWVTA
jgi:hypothetical protein